jgi:hypothetical protein
MLSVVGKAMHKFVLIILAWAFCSLLPIQATDPPTEAFQDRVIQRSNFGALFMLNIRSLCLVNIIYTILFSSYHIRA